MELIFPSVIIILSCSALFLLLQWKNLHGPQCLRGWIPWIGAAFDFGKAPLEFIEKARYKLCGLTRNWSKSKRCLLAFFEKNMPDIKTYKSERDNSMTLMQALLDVIETNGQSPDYGLLLLWASLSSVFPGSMLVSPAFKILEWTQKMVNYLKASHKLLPSFINLEESYLKRHTPSKDKIKVSEGDLKKLPLIKWCNLETICLRAPDAITRKVMKPVKILSYTVPFGDLLTLSPFWLHRNPKYFPGPELFNPERWKEANLEKHAFLDYFMAFGSGKYQCPGSVLSICWVSSSQKDSAELNINRENDPWSKEGQAVQRSDVSSSTSLAAPRPERDQNRLLNFALVFRSSRWRHGACVWNLKGGPRI